MTDDAIPAGTFACPICGKDTPHYHSPEEVEQHRETEAWVEESWQQARPLFFPDTPAPSIVTGSDERAREVSPDAIEAAARAMCDRVNGQGDYAANIGQRRTGWVAQARAGVAAYLAALATSKPPVDEAMREALHEARLQLEYLDKRFPTGTTPATIARIDAAIRNLTGDGAGA